ncbi:MAG TPA: hypothetical protein PKK61_10850 [Defluviitaleaceae bacterium]|jgi:YHS domain-containing protein|nr:hypothetical protein [Candidatus Epulonipiscium sp.]HOA81542.1 hypothetical protein [Defluviitaleaceae bacterium]
MEVMQGLFWIIAIWWLFSSIVRTIRFMQYQKALERSKEANNNINPIDKELDIKAEKSVEVEMVEDAVCGKLINKSKSYQLYHDDKLFYFCSWDCRQKYINEHIKQSE